MFQVADLIRFTSCVENPLWLPGHCVMKTRHSKPQYKLRPTPSRTRWRPESHPPCHSCCSARPCSFPCRSGKLLRILRGPAQVPSPLGALLFPQASRVSLGSVLTPVMGSTAQVRTREVQGVALTRAGSSTGLGPRPPGASARTSSLLP